MYDFALVCGRIIRYDRDSLKHEDNGTVRYKDDFGCNCRVEESAFMPGSLEKLREIVKERAAVMSKKIEDAIAKYPVATDTEKKIIEILVRDGVDFSENNIDYMYVRKLTKNCIQHSKWCQCSLENAYMDLMH